MWRTFHHTMAMKTWRHKCRGRLFPKGGPDVGRPTDDSAPNPPSPPSGPMTRARAKALHDKVNSLLITLDLDTPLDGMLLTADTLCVIRYIPHEAWMKNPEKQLLTSHEEEDEVAGRCTTAWRQRYCRLQRL